jgi:hypothetical protein
MTPNTAGKNLGKPARSLADVSERFFPDHDVLPFVYDDFLSRLFAIGAHVPVALCCATARSLEKVTCRRRLIVSQERGASALPLRRLLAPTFILPCISVGACRLLRLTWRPGPSPKSAYHSSRLPGPEIYRLDVSRYYDAVRHSDTHPLFASLWHPSNSSACIRLHSVPRF